MCVWVPPSVSYSNYPLPIPAVARGHAYVSLTFGYVYLCNKNCLSVSGVLCVCWHMCQHVSTCVDT